MCTRVKGVEGVSCRDTAVDVLKGFQVIGVSSEPTTPPFLKHSPHGIVDDLLATGGTAAATVSLVRQLGGEIVGLDFLVELKGLNGRQKLAGHPVRSMILYP